MWFAKRILWAGSLVIAAVASVVPSGADAALVVDLRATAATGSLSLTNNKSLVYEPTLGAGSATMQIWAVVTGASGNAGLEGFNSAFGGFVSSNSPVAATDGTVRGTLTAVLEAAVSEGSGFTPGSNADLDADTDLDIGNVSNTVTAGWFFGRSNEALTTSNALAQGATFNALADGGIEVLLGTLTFNNLSQPIGGSNGSTQLNWLGRVDGSTFTAFNFLQDGANVNAATGQSVAAGAPISITAVPEPASIALAGFAGLSLLAIYRRRSK